MARAQFSAQVWDQKYKGKLLKHMTNRLEALFDSFAYDAAKIGKATGFNDPAAVFRFKDFPIANKKLDQLLHEMGARVTSLINDGTDQAWKLSEDKNDALVTDLAQRLNLPADRVQEIGRRNVQGLQAFQDRKEKGLKLSQRVWNYVKNDKALIEMSLELGLAEGKSAAELSRDVRGALKEPAKLFRRVRDKETGALRLSRAAKVYHPGPGVYRSSYKNALRMTSTEINMAYRAADYDFYNRTPWIVGVEVKTSPNHATLNMSGKQYPKPYRDICDTLAGVYPKGFKFPGWHPHCRCFAVPKRASDKEIREWAAKPKAEREAYKFGQVDKMPDNYSAWIENNQERVEAAFGRDTLPYFLRDNYVDGDPSKPLLYTVGKLPEVAPGVPVELPAETGRTREEILAAAKARQAARTQEQIDEIQTGWNRRRLENDGFTTGEKMAYIGEYKKRANVDVRGYEYLLKKRGLNTKELVARFEDEYQYIYNEFDDKYGLYLKALDRVNELYTKAKNLAAKAEKEELERIMRLTEREDDITAMLSQRSNIVKISDRLKQLEEDAKRAKMAETGASFDRSNNAKELAIFESIKNAKKVDEAVNIVQKQFPGIALDYSGFKKDQIPIIADMYASLAYHARLCPDIMQNIKFMGSIKGQYDRIVAAKFEEMMETYGRLGEERVLKLAKGLPNIKSRSPRANSNVYAYSDPWDGGKANTNGIAWNGARPYEKTLTCLSEDVAAKFHPIGADKPRSIIDHELGHKLDELLGLRYDREFLEIFNEAKANGISYVQDNLSRYAWVGKNPKAEFIAEAWSEYLISENPRPIAKSVGELILKKIQTKNAAK